MSPRSPLTEYLTSTAGGRTGSTPWPGGDRLRSKLAAFADFAGRLAELSTCKRLRVGCIVVPPDLSGVAAVGYNGPPARLPNDSCRAEAGACGCVHCESNALIKLGSGRRGMVMLCTDSPCEHCAGLIINSEAVEVVVFGRRYRDPAGLDLLTRAGVCWVPLADALRGDEA